MIGDLDKLRGDPVMIRLFSKTILLFMVTFQPVLADEEKMQIESLLKQDKPPAGIVFEIVSDDEDLLADMLPQVRRWITRLREKFPELPIAIVSHGKEQFALASSDSSSEKDTHSITRGLVEDGIDVHVCGTHAGWYGVSPEDFPDYVDVSPVGPTQIDDYEEMGYELIFLTD